MRDEYLFGDVAPTIVDKIRLAIVGLHKSRRS